MRNVVISTLLRMQPTGMRYEELLANTTKSRKGITSSPLPKRFGFKKIQRMKLKEKILRPRHLLCRSHVVHHHNPQVIVSAKKTNRDQQTVQKRPTQQRQATVKASKITIRHHNQWKARTLTSHHHIRTRWIRHLRFRGIAVHLVIASNQAFRHSLHARVHHLLQRLLLWVGVPCKSTEENITTAIQMQWFPAYLHGRFMPKIALGEAVLGEAKG